MSTSDRGLLITRSGRRATARPPVEVGGRAGSREGRFSSRRRAAATVPLSGYFRSSGCSERKGTQKLAKSGSRLRSTAISLSACANSAYTAMAAVPRSPASCAGRRLPSSDIGLSRIAAGGHGLHAARRDRRRSDRASRSRSCAERYRFAILYPRRPSPEPRPPPRLFGDGGDRRSYLQESGLAVRARAFRARYARCRHAFEQ